MFVWIEGADDLTQEAQAFLRRILETAAPNVTCALEVRELWKLSPPILSRCKVVTMRSESSYRLSRNTTIAVNLGVIQTTLPMKELPVWSDIPRLRQEGEDPYRVLDGVLAMYGLEDKAVRECYRAIGAGSSPWIQLTKVLMIKGGAHRV
jgi:hypothetical protein